MVPPMRFFLVGGQLRDDTTRKDADIMGVMSARDFDLTFGYTHQTLQEAHKEKVRSEKFKAYLQANRITGWMLTHFLKYKVDFKWVPPTMAYGPFVELHIEGDVLMCL